jgi:hypothetical protein
MVTANRATDTQAKKAAARRATEKEPASTANEAHQTHGRRQRTEVGDRAGKRNAERDRRQSKPLGRNRKPRPEKKLEHRNCAKANRVGTGQSPASEQGIEYLTQENAESRNRWAGSRKGKTRAAESFGTAGLLALAMVGPLSADREPKGQEKSAGENRILWRWRTNCTNHESGPALERRRQKGPSRKRRFGRNTSSNKVGQWDEQQATETQVNRSKQQTKTLKNRTTSE